MSTSSNSTNSNQQTLADSGANKRPPMLEKGNYIPWESRFKMFLDNKLEDGERMWNLIQNSPYQRPMVVDPTNPTVPILEPLSKMTEGNKKQYITDVRVMNYLLQAIPNDIYNSVDASKEEESLDSVHERLTTLVNIMERNNVCLIPVAINTKFLNFLQPEWRKYVTMVRHNQTGPAVSYDVLYDQLVQFEPHVLASRAKKAAKNHDPLALIAHSNASSSHSHANSSYSPQPYYVTHPLLVVDYDDEYQGELQGYSQEDKLTTAMMLLARAISQKFSTPTNNRYGGNANKKAGRNKTQGFNAGNARDESTLGKANVQCYNCNEKGHYARECQKPKVCDAKYLREQMLLAMKDEAGSNLSNEENDFMLDTSYGEDLEELTAAVHALSKIHEQVSHRKRQTIIQTTDDDQIDSNIIFDDPFVENNGGTSEHDSTAHDEYREIQMLAYNVQREAENKKHLNNELKKQKDLLQRELEMFKDWVKTFESQTIQYSTYKETCDELERELRNDKDTIDRLVKEKEQIQNDFLKVENEKIIIQHETKLEKKAFKEREDRYLDDIFDLEEKLSSHDRIVYKMGQSIQTIHMLGKKPNKVYDHFLKAGLGYTNPERLKKAIATQPKIYDGDLIHSNKLVIHSTDLEETLEDAEEKLSAEQTYFSIPSTSDNGSKSKDVPSESPGLLMIISELKNKLKTIDKWKHVNTKFDKSKTLGKLLCVTPFNKNLAIKAKNVSNTKVTSDRSNPVTSQFTPTIEKKQQHNANVIARGISNSVKRPKSKDNKSKNNVLKNTKSSSTYVLKTINSVCLYSNKCETKPSNVCQTNACITSSKTMNAVNDGLNIVCISCGLDVFLNSHEKCVARNALTRKSSVKRALITSPIAAKSKSLGATSVVAKSRLGVAKTSTATNKVLNVSPLSQKSGESRILSSYMNNKIATNRKWQKWFEYQQDFSWTPKSKTAKSQSNMHKYRTSVIQLILWIVNSGCSKHMTGNLQLLRNFVEKFMRTVFFGNDHFAAITGYGDYGKSRKASLSPKLVPSIESKLELLHMDLCGPMRVASINGKKYIPVIVDDSSRYTWVYFLRTKDEAPDMIIDFVNQVQRNLKASILTIRTDNGTEFKNKKLRSFYAKLGIVHKTLIAQTPQQNGGVEGRNRTLVEAARTMLIFSKAPEFLWAEAIATACFTQNRSIVHTRHNKTAYELIHGRKVNVQYFYVFGSLCYPTNDRDDLGKMKLKADIGIFVGYSKSSRGFRIYNRRTKKIIEAIHVKFDELTAMASECNNLEPGMNCAYFNDSSKDSQSIPSTSDLDNLFGPMYEEYYVSSSKEVSDNSAANTLDNDHTSSSLSIIVDQDDAPLIVSSSEEQIATESNSLVLNEVVDEFVQEDVADFDGNTFHNAPQTHGFDVVESSSTY
ncbi:putative ribonuclease H-like domain-containing protein [Tanacetum coccineum]